MHREKDRDKVLTGNWKGSTDMAGWTKGALRGLLLATVLVLSAGGAAAAEPGATCAITGLAPVCPIQMAAKPVQSQNHTPAQSTRQPHQFRDYLACRQGCARRCSQRFRCRQLRPRAQARCYARRQACIRACGC